MASVQASLVAGICAKVVIAIAFSSVSRNIRIIIQRIVMALKGIANKCTPISVKWLGRKFALLQEL
jgi:hypothetical protein